MTETQSDDVSIAEVQRAHQKLLHAERARVNGNLDQARRHCEELLNQHPDYFAAHSTLGTIFLQGGNFAAALPHLVKAAMLNPKDRETLTNLGRVHFELGSKEQAVRLLNQALKQSPDETKTLYFLARALIALQQHDRAIGHLKHAEKLQPDNARIQTRLGECYLHQNRYQDAALVLKKALDLSPERNSLAYIHRLASSLPKGYEPELDNLADIDTLADPQPDDDEYIAASLEFARASYLERIGQNKEAWDSLVTANAPMAKKYEAANQIFSKQAEELLSRSLSWLPPEKGSKKGTDTFPLSLFIVGNSRSGKTTMEGLIGQCPGVETLQEHDLVTSTARYVSQSSNHLTTYLLSKLPSELDSIIAQTYRKRLLKSSAGADVVTITHPGVISDVGRLVDCVQNVKFIFMKRDEDDTAFRIFGQFYEEDTNQYAYDLNAIYNHLSRQNTMIDNWLEKLGNQAMLVNYEDMIDDPKATLARVAKFCGLKPPSKLDLQIGDDRGCAEPYLKWLKQAR